VETPEKRFWTHQKWFGQGTELPAMNWDDFNNKKILGTVPVDDNGSAYFEVPAEKFVYFQLLDKDGQMIQSMRSGTMVQPGEQNGCIGCHENRSVAPSWNKQDGATRTFPGKPLIPKPRKGKTKEFSYIEEVQPIFDRHCVQCHQPGKKAGETLNLQGDAALVFNPSYSELWAKRYIRPVGGGSPHHISARAWGSSASKLVTTLRKQHAGIQLDSTSLETIITWIDLNAPYYPSYATSYPDHPYGRSPLSWEEVNKLNELTGDNIAPNFKTRDVNFYFLDIVPLPERDKIMLYCCSSINFNHPEDSPALQNLKQTNVEKYQEALAIIAKGQERIKLNGSNDVAGFTPCPIDQWREQKYIKRRAIELENRKHILDGTKRKDQ
jgi:mono/diheme cytochrome c family protein